MMTVAAIMATMSLQAQTDIDLDSEAMYFDIDDLPNAMALLLSEINPDAQDDILKLGYEWGQSRVIAGYHWQSDVDASRLVAAAGYARLHTNDEFLADIAAARAEYAEKSEQTTDAPAMNAIQQSSARIYRIDGTPAINTTHDIIIEDGQKRIRPYQR